jgi:hypothetical protein
MQDRERKQNRHEIGIVMNSEGGYQVLESVYIFSTGFYLQIGARRELEAATRLFNAGGRVKVEEVDKHSASRLTPRTRAN